MQRLLLLIIVAVASQAAAQERPTAAEVLANSAPSDWRTPAPENMLYLQLPHGRVVFELAPQFAPLHSANIRRLVGAGYFDGLSILRSQDNYVVQWGDPDADGDRARPIGNAEPVLDGEFHTDAGGASFTRIDSEDAYAPEVGFVDGFPAARDGPDGRLWLTHCYGMLGVGRGNAADSGNGAQLYVVTGHAPRHLDRNVTLVGRVIDGIEHLATLPRGSGPLGFFESSNEFVPVASMRLGSALPEDERLQVELLRTDTATFSRLVEARRHRAEEWFVDPVDAIEVCNVPLPARPR